MSTAAYKQLDVHAFAEIFSANENEFSERCRKVISSYDFRYVNLLSEARDQAILKTLQIVHADFNDPSGKHRKGKWEKGWAENLASFHGSDGNLELLTPRYIRPGEVLRLNHDYIATADDNFLINFYTVYRQFLFGKYLSNYDHICEFGCGSGINLVLMAQLFPNAELHGFDWTTVSLDIIKSVVEKYGYNIAGHVFDMFHPDYTVTLHKNGAVITLNAMEQLGVNFTQFFNFIMAKSPSICVNSEPLYELYDGNNMIDYLAMLYHVKRGYLIGYLPFLRQKEREGIIEILDVKRVPFGIQFHEAYSYVVWRPLVNIR